MAKRKKPEPVAQPQCFFVEELKGEEPLSLATGRRLCQLAGVVASHQPWAKLLEDDLVFVHDAVRDQNDACSVMGKLGQVYAVVVYLGVEGYHFFRKLQESAEISRGDFFAEQRSISVEYVGRKELTRQDRELLAAAGFPSVRGGMYPKFRAIRPGYMHWYVTEGEARILAGGLDAVAAICHALSEPDCPEFWEREGIYPLVTHDESGYNLRPIIAPKPTRAVPAAAPLDQARIRRILDRKPGVEGVLEADHFHAAAPIGGSHERKACTRVALAVDATSGFLYPPAVAMPETATGEMLADVILGAVETSGTVPREICVRSADYRVHLEPLAKALGSRVTVARSLPELDRAKVSLLKMVGDSGPIRLG
jgi:hypothetical protein